MFDLIAGTSTGGILALGLVCPGEDGQPKFAASDLVEFYRTRGRDIFPRPVLGKAKQLAGPKYPGSRIEAVLREKFGDVPLSAALTDVFIPAYEIEVRRPFFFRSTRATDRAFDYPMWQVARGTSAAPTYFPPCEATSAAGESWAVVDGGLFANNPSMWAVVDLLEQGCQPSELLVVSLGTAGSSVKRKIARHAAARWGLVRWARPIIDIALTAVRGHRRLPIHGHEIPH